MLGTSVVSIHSTSHTDWYLDFASHHPLTHKMGVVQNSTCLHRQICTNITDKVAEREHDYWGRPSRAMTTRTELWIRPSPPPCRSRRHSKAMMTLPYVKHLLELIHRTLTPMGICTCFCPYQTLRQRLTHLKDRIEPDRQTGVVYSIPCRSCTKVYIGRTGHTLEHCLREHRRALVSR